MPKRAEHSEERDGYRVLLYFFPLDPCPKGTVLGGGKGGSKPRTVMILIIKRSDFVRKGAVSGGLGPDRIWSVAP